MEVVLGCVTSKADEEVELFVSQVHKLSLSDVLVLSVPKFNEDDEAETISLVLDLVVFELLLEVPVVISYTFD